jgi:hypothetical protein
LYVPLFLSRESHGRLFRSHRNKLKNETATPAASA